MPAGAAGAARSTSAVRTSAPTPRRRRNGPATEGRILAAAEELLALHGFEGVSTKQIAHRAGVAIGALYHHFRSKEAIHAAVTRRAFARRSTLPADIMASTDPPETRLKQLVAWFIRHVLLDETFGPLLKREMLDPRPSTPLLLDRDHFQQQLALFQALMREISPAADSDEAVAAMLALIFGFANMRGIYALFPNMAQTLRTPEEIAEHATSLLVRGLKPASRATARRNST